MTALIKHRPTLPAFRVKPLLKALDLPPRTRWREASSRLRSLLAQARQSGDLESAKELSQAKEFLKRNLPRECNCGAIINAGMLQCRVCNLA